MTRKEALRLINDERNQQEINWLKRDSKRREHDTVGNVAADVFRFASAMVRLDSESTVPGGQLGFLRVIAAHCVAGLERYGTKKAMADTGPYVAGEAS